MIDLSLKGMRCRATKEIRSPRGMIKRSTEGTIQHDLENVGRRLISVQWDTGITDYVFPMEVEIITGLNASRSERSEARHLISGL